MHWLKFPVKTSLPEGGYFMMMDVEDSWKFVNPKYLKEKKYEDDSII